MGILQPPAGPANPFSLSEYRSHDVLIWITIIIGAIWAFFMLVEYINTRKVYHLFWALAFIAAYIVFHQIALIGSYGDLLTSVSAGLSSIIPGFIAVGLIHALYPDKKIWKLSYGQLYMIFVLIMAVFITLYKLENIQLTLLNMTIWTRLWIPSLLVIISHVPSSMIIFLVPLYTTLKTKETGRPALLVSAGGLLLGLTGFLLSLTLMEVADPFITMGLFPYFLIFAVGCFAFGMLYEKTWRFEIPGVEFED
ncbi:MAG: hypothetical protein ACXABO_04340 [Promethearchaeota archaeon]|jgi:hypothetical protein